MTVKYKLLACRVAPQYFVGAVHVDYVTFSKVSRHTRTNR